MVFKLKKNYDRFLDICSRGPMVPHNQRLHSVFFYVIGILYICVFLSRRDARMC